MVTNHYNKYLKYKAKYCNLKNLQLQKGGNGEDCIIPNNLARKLTSLDL
jgi:hypothetical protein